MNPKTKDVHEHKWEWVESKGGSYTQQCAGVKCGAVKLNGEVFE